MDVVADNVIQGAAQVKLGVYGNSLFHGPILLALVDAEAEIALTVPTYDADSGILSNLNITGLSVPTSRIQPQVISVFGWLSGLLGGAINVAIAIFSQTIIDIANDALAELLSTTPLKIPEFEGFPTETQTVALSLSNPILAAKQADGPDTPAYLDIDLGVDIEVRGTPTRIRMLYEDNSTATNVYKNRTYATAYNWTEVFGDNPNFTCYFAYNDTEGEFEQWEMRLGDGDIVEWIDTTMDGTDWVEAPLPTENYNP